MPNKLTGKNYPNERNHWGYSTVCSECEEKLKPETAFKTKYERAINFDKDLKNKFPVAECNICGRKCSNDESHA